MKKLSILILLIGLFSCEEKSEMVFEINVKNDLNLTRVFETVEVSLSNLELKNDHLKVTNSETEEVLISQLVDNDLDGTMDVLLFQPKLSPNSEANFSITYKDPEHKTDSTLIRCYSRFVPERTDDYAWENNKVAFRTYGPTAQKMIEDSIPGGTLSSGIDAWLKRVDYPIINSWYKKHTSGEGSYHEDTGEGLDNFHVGVSRGVGGIAIKLDSTYAVSKNFISHKTITNGPIRTAFILEYAPYSINGVEIKETKHVMLDYGHNLSRYVISISGADQVSAGLTLHNKDGVTTTNKDERWMSYWEPYFDSELGQGLVVTEKYQLNDFNKFISEEKDKSNLYAELRNDENLIDYYAGFGWKKSGQFSSHEDWNSYLSRFSKCLDSPLKVTIIKSQD